MPRKKSSRRWLQEHFRDPYVKTAQAEGYRSRACYKLLEIQGRDHIIKPGMIVVDLGAAPGGWSQVAASHVGRSGRVVSCDILPMDALAGVEFVCGDFTDEQVLRQLLELLEGSSVDLVISDMAPNMSGMTAVDQPRAMHLAELAHEFARLVLQPGGSLLTKVFQGEGFEGYLRALRVDFQRVSSRKPDASRSRSREMYLLARGFKAER